MNYHGIFLFFVEGRFVQNMASPKKKDLQGVVQQLISDVDVELKAALYDISKGQHEMATKTIERVRRKLTVLEKKSEYFCKDFSKDKARLQLLESVELSLKAENKKLKEKLSNLRKEMQDLTNEDAFQSEDEPLTPILCSQESVCMFSQGSNDSVEDEHK